MNLPGNGAPYGVLHRTRRGSAPEPASHLLGRRDCNGRCVAQEILACSGFGNSPGNTHFMLGEVDGLTPEQRRRRDRMAAHALHATQDPRVTTKPARDAFMARFERQVDPDGTLPELERHRRAEAAKKSSFLGLAMKSAKARQKR